MQFVLTLRLRSDLPPALLAPGLHPPRFAEAFRSMHTVFVKVFFRCSLIILSQVFHKVKGFPAQKVLNFRILSLSEEAELLQKPGRDKEVNLKSADFCGRTLVPWYNKIINRARKEAVL